MYISRYVTDSTATIKTHNIKSDKSEKTSQPWVLITAPDIYLIYIIVRVSDGGANRVHFFLVRQLVLFNVDLCVDRAQITLPDRVGLQFVRTVNSTQKLILFEHWG